MSKLTIRKTALIILFIGILLSQFLLCTKWYSLNNSQYKVSRTITDVLKPNQSLIYSNYATNNYIEAGINFNEYLRTNKFEYFKKYELSLDSMSVYLDSLSFLSKKDENFLKIINAKKNAGIEVITLKKELDSLMNQKVEIYERSKSDDFKVEKYDYGKIINSISFDTVKKVNEKKKKGLFGRIGNALSGKNSVDKEETQTTIKMVFNNRETSGTFQEQLQNAFKITENYYIYNFNQLKKTYTNLREKDNRLLQINKTIFKKSKEIIIFYKESAIEASLLDYANAAKIYNAEISNQKNSILNLIVVIIISTILLLLYTIYAFFSEINLAKAKEVSDLNLEKKNQLIGMLSHEMRAPLNIIANFSEKLKTQNSNTELTPSIDSIYFSSNSLGALVNQILDFIKNEKNQLKLYNSNLNLKNEITSIADSLKSLSEIKGIKLITNIDKSNDVEVWADRVKINQLFYNLIVNAIKFTNNGSITVNATLTKIDEKNRLDVRIIDTGVGIEEADIKNIFDKFYQSKSNNNGQFQFGAGLGLELCKSIVEIYNGKIKAESIINQGTTFSFYLLFEEVNSKQIDFQTHLMTKFEDKKIKIAIVDDDVMTLNILKKLILNLGFEAITFERAPQILHYLNQEVVDAVISDIQIFDCSGLELVREIKKLNNTNKSKPILAITGDAYLNTSKDLEQSFDEIIIKPINKEEFYQKLLTVL